MTVTITKEITPTVTEIADAIWDMSSHDQFVLLSCLHTRFCTNDNGKLQLASVANEIATALNCSKVMLYDGKTKHTFDEATKAKEFITELCDTFIGDCVAQKE